MGGVLSLIIIIFKILYSQWLKRFVLFQTIYCLKNYKPNFSQYQNKKRRECKVRCPMEWDMVGVILYGN